MGIDVVGRRIADSNIICLCCRNDVVDGELVAYCRE